MKCKSYKENRFYDIIIREIYYDISNLTVDIYSYDELPCTTFFHVVNQRSLKKYQILPLLTLSDVVNLFGLSNLKYLMFVAVNLVLLLSFLFRFLHNTPYASLIVYLCKCNLNEPTYLFENQYKEV